MNECESVVAGVRQEVVEKRYEIGVKGRGKSENQIRTSISFS